MLNSFYRLFLILILSGISQSVRAEDIQCEVSTAPLNSINLFVADQEQCKILCETYFQKNEGARPKKYADEICRSRLQKKLDDTSLMKQAEILMACGDGIRSGAYEAVTERWESVVQLADSAKKKLNERTAWYKQCQDDINCRRAFVRQIPPYHEKLPDGSYKMSEVDVDKFMGNRDPFMLEASASSGRSQRASACSPKIRGWFQEHKDNVDAVKATVSNPHDDCLLQYVTVLRKSQESKGHAPILEAALKWLDQLGIKLQCYPEQEIRRLQCYGIAKVVADPLNLIPVAGWGAKVLIAARVARSGATTATTVARTAAIADEAVAVQKVALLSAPESQGIGRLSAKAVEFKNPKDIPGGAGGPQSLGIKKGKFLRTSQIAEKDLPYKNEIRPIDQSSLGSKKAQMLGEKVQPSDIILASDEHSGSAGVVRLGNYDGKPVALKSYALSTRGIEDANKAILKEAGQVKLLSDLGIGPKFHGVYLDEGGRYNIVMDVVRGDFSGMKVTTQTFEDLREIESRMRGVGVASSPDLQIYRTPEGRLQVIDADVSRRPNFHSDLGRDFDATYASQLIDAEASIGAKQLEWIKTHEPERYKRIPNILSDFSSSKTKIPGYLTHLIGGN